MEPATTVILPVRDFDGMSRLSSVLTREERSLLIRELSARAVTAVRGANLSVIVASSSPEVQRWADDAGIKVTPDPGGGLSAVAHAAVASLEGMPWMLLHPDLPLVAPGDVKLASQAALRSVVLVPSHDGGTNLIASTGTFPFAYGPGSFHRHRASHPTSTVISVPGLSIDIDTPAQLRVLAPVRDSSIVTL